jgi:hypothetical protein
MQSAQLVCPHCGSALNYGVDVAAGTPLDCLICMRTFVAEHDYAASAPAVSGPPMCAEAGGTMSDATVPSASITPAANTNLPTMSDSNTAEIPQLAAPAMGKPVSSVKRVKGEVLVSKPYSPPLSSAVAPQSLPKPAGPQVQRVSLPSSEEAPSIRKPDEAEMGKSVVLAAVTIGLLLALTGGVAFAIWKITAPARNIPVEEKLVDNSKDDAKGIDGKGSDAEADKKDGTPPLPVLSPEEKANLLAKVQDEAGQILKRKNPIKPGSNEPDEPDPISSISFNQKPVTGLDQAKINAAIDKGVAYLRKTQNPNGTWHNGHGVGYAAIGGLTLLECGVPANDPAVLKAAKFVRMNAASIRGHETYEMSLAVLFLDRLGDSRDRPMIQGLALRLMAGQLDSGGWTYTCKQLNPKEMYQLYAFLETNKQPDLFNLIGADKMKTQAGIVVNPKRDPLKLDDPFEQLNDLLMQGIDTAKIDPKADPKKEVIPPVNVDPKKEPEVKPKPKLTPIRPEALMPSVRDLPVVQNQGVIKVAPKLKGKGRGLYSGDNSNTQFAMLALWAARRHGVPTDVALLASYQRFMLSQQADGAWGYHPSTGQNAHTMTNVGLLGLAMGHGAAPEVLQFDPKKPKEIVIKPALQDPAIQKGLAALSRYIGQPSTDPKKKDFAPQNMYMLWSIERVAMLYDLKTIGGKDWYGWGAQILVHTQAGDGHWPVAHQGEAFYPGGSPPLNTCFALLFLRRSNLVRDLTHNLRLSTGIMDPEK